MHKDRIREKQRSFQDIIDSSSNSSNEDSADVEGAGPTDYHYGTKKNEINLNEKKHGLGATKFIRNKSGGSYFHHSGSTKKARDRVHKHKGGAPSALLKPVDESARRELLQDE